MRNSNAFPALALLFSGFISLPYAAPDEVSGTVTDEGGTPLAGVQAASEGFTAQSDAYGAFRLVFGTSAVAPSGPARGIAWDPARRAFRSPGAASLRVRTLAGALAAEATGTFEVTLPALPQGLYLAEVSLPGASARFRVAVLAGGALCVGGAGPAALSNAPQGPSAAKAAANGGAHTVVFSKAGYFDFSLPVAAGAPNTGLTVKLKAGVAREESIFDGKTTDGWTQVPANSWEIKDSSLASKGSGRGFIYTTKKWTRYRVIYDVRQLSGDHEPCVLVFGTDPGKDAMAGIQFALPYGVGWDYRAGHNNTGAAYYTKFPDKGKMSKSQWARCEILVDATKGLARAACAQPVGAKAVPILTFKDAAIPNVATAFALQMHNGGIHDEYKNITVENDPAVDDLITTK